MCRVQSCWLKRKCTRMLINACPGTLVQGRLSRDACPRTRVQGRLGVRRHGREGSGWECGAWTRDIFYRTRQRGATGSFQMGRNGVASVFWSRVREYIGKGQTGGGGGRNSEQGLELRGDRGA